jgi:hypothetical protein
VSASDVGFPPTCQEASADHHATQTHPNKFHLRNLDYLQAAAKGFIKTFIDGNGGTNLVSAIVVVGRGIKEFYLDCT